MKLPYTYGWIRPAVHQRISYKMHTYVAFYGKISCDDLSNDVFWNKNHIVDISSLELNEL